MEKVNVQQGKVLPGPGKIPVGPLRRVLYIVDAEIQIALGVVTAVIVIMISCHPGNFYRAEEKMMLLKVIIRWFGMILFT